MDGPLWDTYHPITPFTISPFCTTQNHSLPAFLPSSSSFWTLLLPHPTPSELSNCRVATAMKVLAVTSPVSARAQPRQRLTGSSGAPCQSLHSSFSGMSLQCRPRKPIHAARQSRSSSVQVVMMVKPAIQFIQGTDEQTIPDIRLTKSRDGTNGVAIFTFDQPSVFDSSAELGDITGFYMIDEEGVVQSVDVSARFVNGKPAAVEAKYVMRTPRDWDRFMRFMERYSQANGLQFVKN